MARSHIILLALFISVATIVRGQDVPLPDFGINNDAITCANAQGLLNVANSDVNRVTAFVNGDLTNAIRNAKQALTLTQQACQAQNSLKALIEVKAALKSHSSLRSTLRALTTVLVGEDQKSDLYYSVINDDVQKTSAELVQISKRSSSEQGGANFASVCNDAQSSIQRLVDYLNGLSSKITSQLLGATLPQRIAAINAANTACTTPITQSGTASRVWWNTNHVFVTQSGYVRTEDVNIQFPKAFQTVPSVAIALNGFDTSNTGVHAEVVRATNTGFNVRFTAPQGGLVYYAQITYLATLSDKSGIYAISHRIDRDNDAEYRNSWSSPNDRQYRRALATPINVKNLRSVVFIRGFEFTTDRNVRLDITMPDAATVQYKPWADSKLLVCGLTVLSYSGDDSTIEQRQTQIDYNRILGPGNGERTQRVNFDVSAYIGQPEIVYGVTHLDIGRDYNYRLTHVLEGNVPGLVARATTWADTYLYLEKTNYLIACPSAAKCRK